MPIRDVSERNAFLDNQYGPSHGAAAPSSHQLALFNGSPMAGGVELDASTSPGYARVTIPNDATWPDAVDGQKTLVVTFPAPTGAWDTVTHWGLFNGAALGENDAFAEVLDVTAASGAGPQVQISIYFADDAGA